MDKISVLFVCMGNICRSPTAEGVFRSLVEGHGHGDRFHVDSAGTADWHTGNPPDSRAQLAARQRGVDLSVLRARQVTEQDFELFDLVVAMDNNNLAALSAMASAEQQQRIRLLREFADHQGEMEVPDPYYGGDQGFDLVLDMIEDACNGLITELIERHN